MSTDQHYQMPMFGVEEAPVRTYPKLDDVKAWLESEADSGSNSIALYENVSRHLSFSKTSMVFSHPIRGKILLSLLRALPDGYQVFLKVAGNRAGLFEDSKDTIMPSIGCWTLNISASHNAAVACSLSQVLQSAAEVSPKYYLSARAAQGILNRAERRGKTLPPRLAAALQAVVTAAATPPQDTSLSE